MILQPQLVPSWPKLAWVACLPPAGRALRVLHGPCVEVADEWCVEAVWAGPYAAGDFDRTDLVFGSGVRVRGDEVIFVSSGTTFDRLSVYRSEQGLWIANSLAALLAVTGRRLDEAHEGYRADLQSIVRGLDDYQRHLPLAEGGQVELVYWRNLVWTGQQRLELDKPDTAPDFPDYETYREFLRTTARRLGENLASPARAHRVRALSGISSGYDSTAAAVVALDAGCRQTVTVKDSASLWRGSDSGKPIADVLGMACTEYPRKATRYEDELAVWAGQGDANLMNWAQFDYPGPVTLFFTGWHGEKVWDRVEHDHPDPFVRRDVGSLSMAEYRLVRGFLQCPVPFWGVRHNQQLRALTRSEAMRPWWMGKDYDKPLARRIIEEAGVPRSLFGTVKKNISHAQPVNWPYDPALSDAFRRYLTERGFWGPSALSIGLLNLYATAANLLYRNLLGRLGHKRGTPFWRRLAMRRLMFCWAVDALREHYSRNLPAGPINFDEAGSRSQSTGQL